MLRHLREDWDGRGLPFGVVGRQGDVPGTRACRGVPSLLPVCCLHETPPTFFPRVVHPYQATARPNSALCLHMAYTENYINILEKSSVCLCSFPLRVRKSWSLFWGAKTGQQEPGERPGGSKRRRAPYIQELGPCP